MKKGKHWLFTTATVLLLGLLASTDAALPFKKVSIAKTPASTTSTTSTAIPDYDTEKVELSQTPTSEGEDNKSDNATLSKNSKLTGIPQIDYIWDPNLPRELRGYNLSSYPFLSTVPPMDEIHFKCEGLHDGFYASIEYKCQIYHHCVYGIRHDFLCANFTAFDQRTFICHFASDVDCEGSQKYWNRNDELYMATTTSSTSTTTTEPPPTQPRRRTQRPYQRPYGRRPVNDYYDEDEYEDDYYEDRGHRHKPRPRPRKPQLALEYDDEYDDKRVEAKPARRNRNHYRDEDDLSDDYYEERRSRPAGRRGKPSSVGGGRSKASPRKPGRLDERRSFNDDRASEEPRHASGRRRKNEKRTTPSTVEVLDELDEYEKPYGLDQEEAAEEQTPQKVKTTPKPLTEFITPKAASASVYSRPRAPPRIARPVPINEKKKYSYPVQKNTATTPATIPGDQENDDYYQEQDPEQQQSEEDYEQPPQQPTRNTLRRRTAAPRDQKQNPTRSTLRRPVTDKKPLLDDHDYNAPERQESPRRKRPQGSRTRAPPAAELDFVDDVDYEEKTTPARPQRLRTKSSGSAARKSTQRPRQPIVHSEEEEHVEPASEERTEQTPIVQPLRSRVNSVATARRNQQLAQSTRQRALSTHKTTPAPILENEQAEEEPLETEPDEPELGEAEEPLAPAAPAKPLRPASVRVVKRPFLPSRGGSPYLPRGLQPVGVAVRQQLANVARTTDSTPIDMGSTISGVRLLEHGAPLLRGDQSSTDNEHDREREDMPPPSTNPPRTTLPPRSALPTSITPRRPEPQPAKLNLDELYENDYDVTLNDALDPTLKPLTPQHSHPYQHQLTAQHASYQGRPYASAYTAPAESGAYNPFPGQSNNYQQASIYQNHSPSSPIASALQSQSQSQSQPESYHHSDSYFSSTDIRRRAVAPSQASSSHRHEYAAGRPVSSNQMGARPNQHFYDDIAY